MNVLIGDVFDPALMWVAPVFLDKVKDMEGRLSSDCMSGRLGHDPPECIAIGLRVAVKSSRTFSLWQRGRITSVDHVAGAMFQTNDRVKVDVFLVDAGKTIKNIDVTTRIRTLPEDFNQEEDVAFLVSLEGLVPISKTCDYTKRGQFRNTVSRTWNEHCTRMVHTLIKVSDRQVFYDSEVDVGVRVKGGTTIRVGKLVLELPLMIKPRHQERLKPYTPYITTGMWLQGERRLLNLNECLEGNDFAIKMKIEDVFSGCTSLQPILTLLDEREAQNLNYSSVNTSSSVGEGSLGGGGGGRELRHTDDWDELFARAMDDPVDSVRVEAARRKTEKWIMKHLEDIERHEETKTSSGIADDDSVVYDSDGECYYNCREELE